MANFETVTVKTDLLIVGGGMAATGAAVEAAYWAKKHNLNVTLVDKAALDRSGAVAVPQQHGPVQGGADLGLHRLRQMRGGL